MRLSLPPNQCYVRYLGVRAPCLRPVAGDLAAEIREIDSALGLYEHLCIRRFEVYDRLAPGGPRWQLVMRVQEPDGSFRSPDRRILAPLRDARGRSVAELIRQIEAREAARETESEREARQIGEDITDDLKWVGKRVVPTIDWRERTPPEVRARMREEIRSLAS